MSSIHTPGPWEARAAKVGDDFGIIAQDANAEGGWVCIAECFSDIRRARERAVFEAAANAKLISEAPCMEALLRELVDVEGPQPGTSEWASRVLDCLARIDR